MNAVRKFNARPVRAISCIVTMPVANTIAFGGVAMGNMKAQLAARVAGIMISEGGTPIDTAIWPRIGKSNSTLRCCS